MYSENICLTTTIKIFIVEKLKNFYRNTTSISFLSQHQLYIFISKIFNCCTHIVMKLLILNQFSHFFVQNKIILFFFVLENAKTLFHPMVHKIVRNQIPQSCEIYNIPHLLLYFMF